MDTEKQKEIIKNTLHSIKMHKTTILVGNNGCGKSVVRKMLGGNAIKKITENDKAKTKAVSMQMRTASNPEWGALSSMFHDCEWNPTSLETFHLIKSLLQIVEAEDHENWYFIIDEPEIGMSKESQLGLANFLRDIIPVVNGTTYGMMIITHSEYLVDKIKDLCEFINMSSLEMTADDWINREIVPTDFEKLNEDADELYHALLPKN